MKKALLKAGFFAEYPNVGMAVNSNSENSSLVHHSHFPSAI